METHVKRLIPDYDNFAEIHAKRSMNLAPDDTDPDHEGAGSPV